MSENSSMQSPRSSILAIGGTGRIRRLICRLLTAGFFLRLVQRFFGFLMDCFGAFLCFLAYGFSCFLGLSADCLGSLLGFVSDGFSGLFCFLSNSLGGFFGLLACGFKSVLDRLSRFFCSVLYVFYCAFLAEGGESRGGYHSNSKDRYFDDCLLFICFPCTKKTDAASLARALSRVGAATSP